MVKRLWLLLAATLLFIALCQPFLQARPTLYQTEKRAALVETLRRRGHGFIGQELVSLSTTPVWHDGTLRPAPMALRVYLAAEGDGYVVVRAPDTEVV